jgi:hypothetical protein
MMSTRARQLSLVRRTPHHAQAEGAADAAVADWRDIEATLVPLIGKLGFVALYLRCIALRGKEDPWLRNAHEAGRGWDDFTALHVALRGRPDAEAAGAQRELLRVFHDVLTSLLGAPLVARLFPSLVSTRPTPP